MDSWENLDMLQSSHKIHLEIKMYFGSEAESAEADSESCVQNVYQFLPAKAIAAWYHGYPNFERRKKGLVILANLEFVKQKWPTDDLDQEAYLWPSNNLWVTYFDEKMNWEFG